MDLPQDSGIARRDSFKVIAAGTLALGLAPAARAASADGADLERAFLAAYRSAADNPAAMPADRLALLADNALVIDHDVPFLLDRAEFADHLAFHAAHWERVETRFHDLRIAVHDTTGIVSAYFVERGKPRGAGFRLRAGYCTAVCARQDGRWQALGLHTSPIIGQITDASPS